MDDRLHFSFTNNDPTTIQFNKHGHFLEPCDQSGACGSLSSARKTSCNHQRDHRCLRSTIYDPILRRKALGFFYDYVTLDDWTTNYAWLLRSDTLRWLIGPHGYGLDIIKSDGTLKLDIILNGIQQHSSFPLSPIISFSRFSSSTLLPSLDSLSFSIHFSPNITLHANDNNKQQLLEHITQLLFKDR